MEEERMDAAFKELKNNMPRAPEALVERMVKTVQILGAEREKRFGADKKLQRTGQKERQREAKKKTLPELGVRKPPGM